MQLRLRRGPLTLVSISLVVLAAAQPHAAAARGASGAATWRELSPPDRPPARGAAGFAYDAARREAVLIGGSDGTVPQFGDTWTFDGRTWTERQPAASPPLRSAPAMGYDPLRRLVVLFGGTSAQSGWLGDTWTWDGSTWTKESPGSSPPPRSGAEMANDR